MKRLMMALAMAGVWLQGGNDFALGMSISMPTGPIINNPTPTNAGVSVPLIASISPLKATNGAVVSVSGFNFSPVTASNIVYFGAVRATVVTASQTNLTVTVPVGATYAPVTVLVDGLMAASPEAFTPTFFGNGQAIDSSTLVFGGTLETSSAYAVKIADLNGDGKPDLVVVNVYGDTISIFQNVTTNGILDTTSFAAPVILQVGTGEVDPTDAICADLDGDGKLDLVVADRNQNQLVVFKNIGSPGAALTTNSFAAPCFYPTAPGPFRLAVQDLDGDGYPDLISVNGSSGTLSILRNLGTGLIDSNSFAARVDLPLAGSSEGVAVGDLDGDGKPDLAVADSSGFISLFQNQCVAGSISTNSFASRVDLPAQSGSLFVVIADLDGDGRPELISTAYLPQTMSVYHNQSTPGTLTTNSFTAEVDYGLAGRGHTLSLGDLNGDGVLDIAEVTELSSALSLFQNLSAGNMTNVVLGSRVDFGAGYNAWGVAVGDLDGDGRPDVVFANQYDNTVSLYQNAVPFGSKLSIISQPQSQTVMAGGTAAFAVRANGLTTLHYQWTLGGANLAGATNATLTLTNVHVSQAGNYAVKVSNTYGTITSSNAWLSVVRQTNLIYSYTGNEQVVASGVDFNYAYSGELFYSPATTNFVFVGWGKPNGQKQYWVSTISDSLLLTVPGRMGQSYTVFGRAGTRYDDNGQPHVWSYLHEGQNARLSIGQGKYFTFPSTLSYNGVHVYPETLSTNLVLRKATSVYSYQPASTQSANNGGKNLVDLINDLKASLARQGYQAQ